MSGWWRDNRAWLAALPVAAAVGAGASAYQVRTFWWESGMHRKVAAPVGGCAQAPGIRTLRAATISADRSRPRPRLLRGNRQPPAGISRGTSGTRWPLANEERVMTTLIGSPTWPAFAAENVTRCSLTSQLDPMSPPLKRKFAAWLPAGQSGATTSGVSGG